MSKDKLIKQFNTPETSLIISGYPEPTGQAASYGISWYTKETIAPLAKRKNCRFVVLAEINRNNTPKVYQEGKILVLRVFDPRHLSLYPRILTWLSKFDKIRHVFVHSEFGANGGVKNFALLIPFLLLIKLTGRKITFFSHNFVESFNPISTHLNFRKNSLKLSTLNILLYLYNTALGLVANRVVVMDEAIKLRAKKYIAEDKLIYFPLFVKKKNLSPQLADKKEARKILGIKKDETVILYFGFITWYKGADWLINQVQSAKCKAQSDKVRLILAGGPAYSLKDKPYYQKFYQEQLEKVSKTKNIKITGFVLERDIEIYFKAADLIVFPYRGFIGASGALTYAFAFQKPFVVSSALSEMLKSSDIASLLSKLKINPSDLIFKLEDNSFENLIEKTKKDKKWLLRLASLSREIAEKRDYQLWLDQYFKKIYVG